MEQARARDAAAYGSVVPTGKTVSTTWHGDPVAAVSFGACVPARLGGAGARDAREKSDIPEPRGTRDDVLGVLGVRGPHDAREKPEIPEPRGSRGTRDDRGVPHGARDDSDVPESRGARGDDSDIPEPRRGLSGHDVPGRGMSVREASAPGTPAPATARGEHPPAEPSIPAPSPAPPRRTVRRTSVRGQVLEALRSALVGGELVPGEVYSAPGLGERFGVSATPVREAMQQLALEGAVEVVPNRGFRVTERSARELAELAEVRALIEVPVMLRLARTVPAERWAELRPLAEATAVAASVGDRAGYAESDRAFHRAVLALSGNQQLVAIADDLHRRAQWPLTNAPAAGRAALLADAAEHSALLDALTAQDFLTVQSLVREHFAGAS